MSKGGVFFSVVIPTYNASKTIRRTLDSIVSQSYKDFEVIVVDDASDDFDKLENIVNEYRKCFFQIKLVWHEYNKNGAAARNTGILAASGVYVAFIDADDEWFPEKLEVYKTYIESIENSEKLVFYGPVLQNNSIRPSFGMSSEEHVSEYLFLAGGFIQTSTICLSLIGAKSILFDERFRRHQDYDFCLRAYSAGYKFLFIEQPLVRYNVQGAAFKLDKESLSYSAWWLVEMKKHMSQKGRGGFYIFNLCGRALLSGKYGYFLHYFFVGLILLGPLGLYRARRKVAYILGAFRKVGHT